MNQELILALCVLVPLALPYLATLWLEHRAAAEGRQQNADEARRSLRLCDSALTKPADPKVHRHSGRRLPGGGDV